MANDLVIPIYIDTNALLDVLASIEGGFSIIEKITTRESSSVGIDRGVKAEVGTEFGVPNVLSLLKLALGYSTNWKKEKGEQSEKETERYYTYGALFYRLREYLDGNDLIKRLDDSQAKWEAIKPSDFVEIRGVFHPNPFATSLGILDRLLGMSQLFIGLSEPRSARATHEKALTSTEERKMAQEEKRVTAQAREQAKAQTKQMDDFRKIIQGVLNDIQSERIRIFVIDLNQPVQHKAVSLLFLDYLRDQSLSEISNREYRMLGKVVRKVEKESGEYIDLLTGTGLGGISKITIGQFVEAFAQMPGMNMPEIETEISGPAFEIVPIAVFV